jgi:hypothetical protein
MLWHRKHVDDVLCGYADLDLHVDHRHASAHRLTEPTAENASHLDNALFY